MEPRDSMSRDRSEAQLHSSREISCSEPPYGHRRNSSEDGDPTLTRKRQRLDGKVRESRSLSVDREGIISNGSGIQDANEQPTGSGIQDACHQSPTNIVSSQFTSPSIVHVHPEMNDTTPQVSVSTIRNDTKLPDSSKLPSQVQSNSVTHQRTSSKFTINLRESRPGHVTQVAAMAAHDGSGDTASPDVGKPTSAAADESLDPARWNDGTHASSPLAGLGVPNQPEDIPSPATVAAIALSLSSPDTERDAESPKVEAAEPDYMDEGSDTTQWAPLISEVDARPRVLSHGESLIANFPCNNDQANPMEIVAHVAASLEKGAETSGVILLALSDWFARCLAQVLEPGFDWHAVFLEQPKFWSEVPSLIEHLLRRRLRFSGSYLNGTDQEDLRDLMVLQVLFTNYTRVARRLLLCDIEALKQCATRELREVPNLISGQYLHVLPWIFTQTADSNEVCLWSMMQQLYREDVDDLVVKIANDFFHSPTDGLSNLTDFARLISQFVCLESKLCNQLWISFAIAQKSLCIFRESVLRLADPTTVPSVWRTVPDGCVRMITLSYTTLHHLVRKEVSLPRDFIDTACDHLSNLMYELSQADRQSAVRLLDDKGGINGAGVDDVDDLDNEDLGQIVVRAWRLSFLRSCLASTRLDMKAQGLVCLNQDLLASWNKFREQDTIHHPVLQYLANFVLRTDVIGCLIGIDAHLQLIDRASNIIGFLMVTDNFTAREIDLIWSFLVTSHNPRAVAAVLKMLLDVLSLTSYVTLIDFCEKLYHLRLESFDATMIEFASSTLLQLRERFKTCQLDTLDAQPFDLCVSLLRQATAAALTPTRATQAIAEFAARELKELLLIGPSPLERRRIYTECVADIESKSDTATGSQRVIRSLLVSLRRGEDLIQELRMLCAELDLARVLIEEMDRFLDVNPRSLDRRPALRARLDLLSLIIVHDPSRLVPDPPEQRPDLGLRLWEILFTRVTNPASERDLGWHGLTMTLKSLHARNTYIDRIIMIFLPSLAPEFFTHMVLKFVEFRVVYEQRLDPRLHISEGGLIEFPGVDQMWRIIFGTPSDELASTAISLLVSLFVQNEALDGASRSSMEATHLDIVHCGVRRLLSAAKRLQSFTDGTMSGEDEPMVIVPTACEVQLEEWNFIRSIRLLREFLRRIRSSPQYSPRPPTRRSPPPLPEDLDGPSGCVIDIRYQAFNGKGQPPILWMRAALAEPCQVLGRRISDVTGFTKFKLYRAGKQLELDAEPMKTVEELGLGSHPVLIINQVHDSSEILDEAIPEGLTAVEVELLQHYGDVYSLLGLEEKFAAEIWEFLSVFTPRKPARQLVASEKSTVNEIFPPSQPFKIMYSARTLQTCLEEMLEKGFLDEAFMTRSVRTVVAALMNQQFLQDVSDVHLKVRVVSKMMECLLRFLREPASPATSKSYIDNPDALLDKMMAIIKATTRQESWTMNEANNLACDTFAVMLEASVHSGVFWKAFIGRPDTIEMVENLILDDYRTVVRANVGQVISNFCKALPAETQVGTKDFALFFWESLSSILPRATHRQAQSAELFETTHSVMQCVVEVSSSIIDVTACINIWGMLLKRYDHTENVSQDCTDSFVSGLTKLLFFVVQLARSSGTPIAAGDLAQAIFTRYLFPDLSRISDDDEEQCIAERIPILHTPTRHQLNEVLLLLSQDLDNYRKVIDLVHDLTPEKAESNINWQYQRSKALRSPTGYVGLQNQSNTCYLNSLFTQLFMNIDFRGFMLDANVADADGSQRLLSETQKLFGHMQNSWKNSVEPVDLTASIRTYDSESIDVNVQMDVDEFYNLLFDRWEGQILSEESKREFRSFYGGRLLQQVKSSCGHVSELEEPFSAIQCDIKGKGTLEESLQAYVEGDPMEGDNRYLCETCDLRHDAIKRACLKEIPDNLIFHLKRFDYDVRLMVRSKLNDHFAFPQVIDMRPYSLSGLLDPDASMPEDPFELVGVLVHAGTAESGHYYSYIRERPTTVLCQGTGWVQFNDADVTPWDPANMESQCYGGNDAIPGVRGEPMTYTARPHSAYMLFYQRASSLQRVRGGEVNVLRTTPQKLPIPRELGNYIALDNELLMRKYCLHDPSHAEFIQALLDALQIVTKGSSAEEREIDKKVIGLSLRSLETVMAQTKDAPHYEAISRSILRVVGPLTARCRYALERVCSKCDFIRNLLMRCPHLKVRRDFARMVFHLLSRLREHDPALFGLMGETENSRELRIHRGAFRDVLIRLTGLSDFIDVHMRAWDDYFGLVVSLASFGHLEAGAILERGLLVRCLEILVAEFDRSEHRDSLRGRYGQLLRNLAKGRKPSYDKLIELVWVLLQEVNLRRRPARDQYGRSVSDEGNLNLTGDERRLLSSHQDRNQALLFLSKMLDTNHNPRATNDIVGRMTTAHREFGWTPLLFHTLTAGIAIDPASLAAPYLEAAVTFCRNAPGSDDARLLLEQTARGVRTIGAHGGRDHLQFFHALANVVVSHPDVEGNFYRYHVIRTMNFWAPTLLTYWEARIQTETEALINELGIGPTYPPEVSDPTLLDILGDAVATLCPALLRKAKEAWLAPNKTIQTKTVEPTMRVLSACRQWAAHAGDRDFAKRLRTFEGELRPLLVDELDETSSNGWADNDSSLSTDPSDIEDMIPIDPGSP